MTISCHPEAQQQAHEELDRIVGRDRLPTVVDEEELPFIRAIIKVGSDEHYEYVPHSPRIPGGGETAQPALAGDTTFEYTRLWISGLFNSQGLCGCYEYGMEYHIVERIEIDLLAFSIPCTMMLRSIQIHIHSG